MYVNIWKAKGLHRKFTGVINGDEILIANFELYQDPRYQNIEYIINDFSEATEIIVSTEYTSTYAKFDGVVSEKRDSLNIAIVVHEEHKVIARAYQAQMKDSKYECEIFDNLEKAFVWVKE